MANAEKIRYNYIDILKTYAVFMMIIGHTLDAVLAPAVKTWPAYRIFIVFRGLTSASFFIASGSGLFFAFQSKRDAPWFRLLIQRLTKILPILIAGYFLHLPYLSAVRLFFHSTSGDWRQLMQCDTLQNICYSIIILQVILVALIKRSRVFLTALVLMLLVLGFTPLIHARLISPVVLVQLFTPKYGSLFPLFPFAAYIFGGTVLAIILSALREKGGFGLVRKYFFSAGLALLVVSFWLKMPVFGLYCFRIGSIMIFVGLLTFAEGKTGKIIHFFQAIGKESLVIYLIHLMIVYGSVINPGFRQYIGDRLSALPGSMIALGLAAVMVSMGWIWNRFKCVKPGYAKLFRNALIAVLLAFFIFNP
jgi:acyltransferase